MVELSLKSKLDLSRKTRKLGITSRRNYMQRSRSMKLLIIAGS